jgi:hypothetical protein
MQQEMQRQREEPRDTAAQRREQQHKRKQQHSPQQKTNKTIGMLSPWPQKEQAVTAQLQPSHNH